ncbi:NAD(P)-binding domain-containing protein [Chloroflexota bacterium]
MKNKSVKVGVVGLGYVGLPLALAFTEVGFRVLGFDVQQKRVDLVNQGKSYIADVSNDRLSTALANGTLEATTDQSRLGEVDSICICVPTPLTKTKAPDLSYVIQESEEISKHLRPRQLVIVV